METCVFVLEMQTKKKESLFYCKHDYIYWFEVFILVLQTHLKLLMNCLKASTLLDSGTMTLMMLLRVLTLSLFTFITGPKGRKRTSWVKL